MVWFRLNSTGTEIMPLSNADVTQYLVPLQEHLIMTIVAIFSLLFLFLFVYDAFNIRHMLDRYRLKYGFDRELESKWFNEPTEDKLNRKEKYFKRRVFKD